MSLKGIVAIRRRGANTPTNQIEDAFKKLGVKGSIVDSDEHHGVEFVEIHEPDTISCLDWLIGTGIGLILVIDLFRLVFGR